MYDKILHLIKEIESGNYDVREYTQEIMYANKGLLILDKELAHAIEVIDYKLDHEDYYTAKDYTDSEVERIKKIINERAKKFYFKERV